MLSQTKEGHEEKTADNTFVAEFRSRDASVLTPYTLQDCTRTNLEKEAGALYCENADVHCFEESGYCISSGSERMVRKESVALRLLGGLAGLLGEPDRRRGKVQLSTA